MTRSRWSEPLIQEPAERSRPRQHLLPQSRLMFDAPGSGSVTLAVLSHMIAVPSVVLLAGRLPAHSQMPGDIGPPHPQPDRVVDQRGQLLPGLIPRDPGTGDLLQHLRRGQPCCPLHGSRRGCRRPVAVTRLHVLHLRAGPAPGLAHVFQDASGV